MHEENETGASLYSPDQIEGQPARIPLVYPCGEPPAPGLAREIAPGVFWLRMPLPLALSHINLWAVRDKQGWAIFDTGMHTPETVQAWRTLFSATGALGPQGPSAVLVTHLHPDHVGMAGWLTTEYACELWMTLGEYMTCRTQAADLGREAPVGHLDFYRRAGWDDGALDRYRTRFGGFAKMIYPLPSSYRRLRDGQTLQIGEQQWQVIVGAGHSPEHACFYCPELKLLISGDQVLPRISSNVSVQATEPRADPLDDWLQSVANLKQRVPDDVLVLPAHDDPFLRLHARLDHLDSSHRRALDRLQVLLVEGPKRAVDVFPALFSKKIKGDLLSLATGESLANLNYLVERGSVVVTEDADGVAWYSNRSVKP
ncbi:MBL fold metallo-hydrolase [Pseudomonas sp. PB120]|uniref:MBL fold metallo-hydrolase n=1 Tax=Pseudomonas sp. PB120 TaxID=2494700 RepID=UPI0012FD3574|nr:MBL fold metallo-hydrolase [Pseudomonas sp. PB120]MVV49697.1 MBL fold metallo-hydrolase [Pseudomonas sp. PB120]